MSDLFVFAEGAGIGGMISAGLGSDALDYSARITGVAVDLALGTASGTTGVSDIEDVTGSAGADTLTGDGGVNLLIGGAANDALSGGGGDDTLIGEAGVDSFIGGLGIDTLLAEDIDNIWNITGLNAGTLNSGTFTGIENLVGGNAVNTYVLADGAAVTGSITGAGSSWLDYSGNTTGINVDLEADTATGVGGTVVNIVNVIGGSGNDTLTGADGANAWSITGVTTGTVGGVSFSNIENLGGGAGADSFTFSTGSAVDSVTGGSGGDTLTGADTANSWGITGVNAGSVGGVAFSGIENLQGGADADSFTFSEGADIAGTVIGNAGSDVLDYSATISGVFIDLTVKEAETVVGGTGSDTLSGPAADTAWTVDGADSGNVAGVTFFSGIENLTGAADNEDTFTFTPTGSLSGVVAGGAGGFDTVVFDGGTFDTIIYNATGSDSGTINFDGTMLTYAGMEPIVSNNNANNLIFQGTDSFLGLGGNDQIRLKNHADPGKMIIQSDNGTFEEVIFNLPSSTLTIDARGGEDTIIIESVDPGFELNKLTVDGGGGTDDIVTGKISDLIFTSSTVDPWFTRANIELLDPSYVSTLLKVRQVKFSGATIVTHGFQPTDGSGDSLLPIAQAIHGLPGKSWVLDLDVLGTDFNPFLDTGRGGFDTGDSVLPEFTDQGQAGELILLWDWATVSQEFSTGFTEAAADALFSQLVNFGIIDLQATGGTGIVDLAPADPKDTKPKPKAPPLHFIAHSFGAAVNTEVIERLAFYDIKVDHATFLDPHDFDEEFLAIDGTTGQFELNKPQGPAVTDEGYGVTIWDNIEFADVYYQTESFSPRRRPIPGAYNVWLDRANELPDVPLPHSWVWDGYYLGSIAPDKLTYVVADGEFQYNFGGTVETTPAPLDFVAGFAANPKIFSSPIAYFADTGYQFSRLTGGESRRPTTDNFFAADQNHEHTPGFIWDAAAAAGTGAANIAGIAGIDTADIANYNVSTLTPDVLARAKWKPSWSPLEIVNGDLRHFNFSTTTDQHPGWSQLWRRW